MTPAAVLRSCAVAATSLALVTAGVGVATAATSGTTRYVSATNGVDTGDCSVETSPCKTITYAIFAANAGDTVSIAAGTYTEDVSVTKSITLRGAGSGKTRIMGDGNSSPVVDLDGGATIGLDVSLANLTIAGTASSTGILVDTADAQISGSIVSGNGQTGIELSQSTVSQVPYVTVSHSSIVGNGAGIGASAGSVTVDHSTVNGNFGGGVVVMGGSASVASSTVDGNTGAGVVVIGNHASASVTHSTVSHTAPFSSGISSGSPYGSGVLAFPGTSALVDTSTVYGNSYQGVLALSATVSVDNSTIAGTTAPSSGGNGFADGNVVATPFSGLPARATSRTFAEAATPSAASNGGSVTVTGSINAASTAVPACGGTTSEIHDGGYNLASDASCKLSATGSRQKVSAKLGTFADNGGPTKTLLPANTGPAVDAIPLGSAHCDRQTTDQRGVSRPQGPKCDIGAVELAQKPLVITTASLPKGRVGKSYRTQLKATGGPGKPYSYTHSGSLPAGLKLSTSGLISGKPTKAGSHTFTVTVDKRVSKKFTLVVTKAG